jgi:O-antigen/teichoic acid export membrane protein
VKKLLLSASTITIFVMGINFFFKIFLSYKIPKESLGLFYTFMDILSLGLMFFAGFKDSLVKAYDEENFQKILYWYVVSFWIIFLIILFLEVIYYEFFFQKFFSIWHLIFMFFLQSLALFFSYFNSANKVYKIMLFETLVMTLGTILGFLIFSNFFKKIEALFFAFSFGYFLRFFYIKLFSPIKLNYQKSPLKEAKNFFKNNLLSSLMYFFSGLFISSTSLVILKLFDDLGFLSEFQVVIRSIFFSLVAVFVFPINTFTFPEISKEISKNNFKRVFEMEKVLIKYLIIFEIIICLFLPFSKFFISLIFPKNYLESYLMLNCLLPTLPFIAYTTLSLNILKGFNRFDLALYVRIFGSFCFFGSVVLFFLLGFDAKSVILALDLSFFGMFLLSVYFKQKLLKFKSML